MARQSSNAFASGCNQNCGNFITETPSTRVKAPPGGRSSISLGWGDEGNTNLRREQRQDFVDRDVMFSRTTRSSSSSGYRSRESCNAFARGSNQNCGNFITATPTTRVAAPPGGRSSVSLGWQDDHACQRSATPCRAHSQREHEYYDSYDRDAKPRSGSNFDQRSGVSSNAFACGSNQNCGNFVSDVPTTRVAAPPGGRSSLSLAWGQDSEVSYNSRRSMQQSRASQWDDESQVSYNSGRAPQQEHESFEGVGAKRLQQMFQASKQRTARIPEHEMDMYYAESSSGFYKQSKSSVSTTASSSAGRSNRGFDDSFSDADSDCLPLGAEWSNFNQHCLEQSW